MLCVTDLAQANCLFNMVIKFPEVLSAGTFYPQCTNEKSKKQTTCPVLNIRARTWTLNTTTMKRINLENIFVFSSFAMKVVAIKLLLKRSMYCEWSVLVEVNKIAEVRVLGIELRIKEPCSLL